MDADKSEGSTLARNTKLVQLSRALTAMLLLTLSGSLPVAAKPLAAPSKKASVQAYVLSQFNAKSGPQTVTVAPTAVRVELIKQHIVVLMATAGKLVQILNASKNVYFETDLEKYKGGAMQGGSFIKKCKEKGIAWHTIGSGIIGGVQADDYVLGREPGKADDRYANQPVDVERHHYWTARDIPVTTGCAGLLARMGAIVTLNKVPLRLTLVEHSGKIRTGLDTLGCKKTLVDPSIFVLPANAKKVHSELEAVAGVDRSELPGLGSLVFKTREGDFDADEEPHLPPAPQPTPSKRHK